MQKQSRRWKQNSKRRKLFFPHEDVPDSTCYDFDRDFQLEWSKSTNGCNLKGKKVSVFNAGARHGHKQFNEGKFYFTPACVIKLNDRLHQDDYYRCNDFAPVWARRPQNFQGYVKNCIDYFGKKDVTKYCLAGRNDKRRK